MKLFTAGPSYQAIDRIDVSKMGNDSLIEKKLPHPGSIFAPSWRYLGEALRARKGQGMSPEMWENYKLAYLKDLRGRFKKDQELYKLFFAIPEATITCFCRLPDQCHRTILATYLLPLTAKAMGVPFEFGGERQGVLL